MQMWIHHINSQKESIASITQHVYFCDYKVHQVLQSHLRVLTKSFYQKPQWNKK